MTEKREIRGSEKDSVLDQENFERAWEYLQKLQRDEPQAADSASDRSLVEIWSTLIDRAPRLLLPLAIDTFDTGYTGNEHVLTLAPPDLSMVADPLADLSCADVRFAVEEEGGSMRRYHVAAESTLSPNMSTHMLAYNFCEATEYAAEVNGRLIFQWPRSLVVCLGSAEPSSLELPMQLTGMPSGRDFAIPAVPVVNIAAARLDEILRRNLLLLLPFYVLRYVPDMTMLASEPAWLSDVAEHYERMSRIIARRVVSREMSIDDALALSNAMLEVLDTAASDHPVVHDRIESVVREVLLAALPTAAAYVSPVDE